MSYSDAIISNLTNKEIELNIINSTDKTNSTHSLPPSQSINLKVLENPYKIVIKRADSKALDIKFETPLSCYMSVMIDHSINKFYIQDFLNNKKITENSLINIDSDLKQVNESLGN